MMLRLLLDLLAPGEKLPPGATQFSFGYDGLSWGWAFFALVALVAVTAWSYRRFAPGLGRFSRVGLVVLRSILLGLLLLLLVRPVLIVTLEETLRRPFLVLLDTTQSMGIADKRTTPGDLERAALATGQINPGDELKQSTPQAGKDLSRRDLLEGLAANTKLNLWPRLQQRSSLVVYGFGRKLAPLGDLGPEEGAGTLTASESASFFHGLHYDENLTALGDSLHQLLDEQRGQPLAGILVITDGANNTGISPVEAAAVAKQDGVPLFLYGVGVVSPQDIMVSELDAPQTSYVKEKLTVKVHFRGQKMSGQKATVQLKANGNVVDEQPIDFRQEGEQEITLGYKPTAAGLVELEASIPPLPEEQVKSNNSVKAGVRIVDDKIKVLLVEEEPNWDFQYLLAALQRDRRIQVKSVLLKGDPELDTLPDSPFLSKIPEDRETLLAEDMVILGDVGPADLGDARMKLLSEWVNKMGGSIIFHAGPKADPNAFRDSPLEPIIPVELTTKPSDPYPDPVHLKLTPAGELSEMLSLAENPQENSARWAEFPGVRWTANVGRARPAAQVLLVDPTPARANPQGLEPVIALQNYGLGQSLYIGFDETYRWRSKAGEKYYARIWGQIIQALTAQHVAGASALTQLRTERTNYLAGDKVRITGRILQPGFTPLPDSEVAGTLTFTPATKTGRGAPAPQTRGLRLQALADRPGDFRGEFTASVAGSYSYTTLRDPSVALKFQVAEPHVELSDIAMNEKLLRAMASASGGRFLREEDLNGLPEMINSQSSESVSFKKIPLAFAPILLVLIVLTACTEWLWRRKLELK